MNPMNQLIKIKPALFAMFLLIISCEKSEMNEIDFLLNESDTELFTVSEAHIQHFPQPLQRYLNAVGVVGRSNSNAIKLDYSGNFKLNENAEWAPMVAVTYVTSKPISRNWIGEINSPMGKMTGLDYYCDGNGKLDIRMAPSVPFMFSDGYELSVSELIAFRGELVYNPSACLNDQIRWEEVSETSVRATVEDAGLSVSGIFYFDENDLITHFESDDRYFGDTKVQIPWTVYVDDYKEFSGIKIPTVFRAVWSKDEGDYEYINATITGLTFDIYKL
jgi:hypothetical protein